MTRRLASLAAVGLAIAFTLGWTAGSTAAATSINRGLLTAFNSVGQNLFGTSIFGASIAPVLVDNLPAVQLDVSDHAVFPVLVNIHPGFPPNPVTPVSCTATGLQLRLPGANAQDARPVLTYDPELYPGFIVEPLPDGYPPNPCGPLEQ